MLTYNSLVDMLASEHTVWVRLYDNLIICLTGVFDASTFIAKFTPCADNSREYKIRFTDIKELTTPRGRASLQEAE